jgi:hypothetical protein
VSTIRRRRQKRIEKFVELCMGTGALLGLLNGISYAEHHPARHCTKREIRGNACVNRTIQDVLTPYAAHILVGALIGLLVAAALVFAWKVARGFSTPRP